MKIYVTYANYGYDGMTEPKAAFLTVEEVTKEVNRLNTIWNDYDWIELEVGKPYAN